MLDCLIDYVGLKVCGDETSESGVYINSLPGISLESIDKTADNEQKTYAGVWADVQSEASVRFYTDFIQALSECYKLQPYCDYEEMICNNKQHLVNAWRYLLGNQLMLFRLYTSRLNRYTTVGREDAEKLRDLYQVDYEKALKQAVKFVHVGDCCIECNPNPNQVAWLP